MPYRSVNLALTLHLMLSLSVCGQVAGTPSSATPGSPAPAQTASGVIDDLSAPLQVRGRAARELIADPTSEGRERLSAILDAEPAAEPLPPGAAPDSQWIVLKEAAAGTPALPEWTIAQLVRLTQRGAMDRRTLAVEAIGAMSCRQSISLLLSIASTAETREMKSAVLAALVRSTGQTGLGSDLSAWSTWHESVRELPEVEWQRRIAEAQSRRADANARELQLTTARMEAVLKDQFQSLSDPEARSAQLATLIRDGLASVRRLGLDLALRELANARPLKDEVALAAASVLEQPDAELRKSAADLLAILAPPSTAESLHRAITQESDPRVASAMLTAVARWPSERIRSAAIRWFQAGETTRNAALGVLVGLDDAGLLSDEADRSRILSSLRLAESSQLPVSGLRLLLSLGDDADAARVERELNSADSSRKQSAADALAGEARGRGVDALLRRARTDPAVFAQTVRAVRTFRASPEGYAALSTIAAPSLVERERALLELTGAMPLKGLLSVARASTDLRVREAMLSRLTTEPERVAQSGSSGPTLPVLPMLPGGGPSEQSSPTGINAQAPQNADVVEGLVLLCQTRLELRQPGAALRALDALSSDSRLSDAGTIDSLRTLSLLWLGRVDEALTLSGSPESWVEGLVNSIGQMHADKVIAGIDRHFGDTQSWDANLRARLEQAKARAATFVGPMPEPMPR